jgi:hypothetical protein
MTVPEVYVGHEILQSFLLGKRSKSHELVQELYESLKVLE